MLYSLLGIPLARVAERVSRVNIIARAILVWSTFTALCGAAGSFATLAAFRFGVGIGEAGLSPSAHSLISDYFGPRERTSALSLYNLGIPLGIMVGAMAGGWLTQNFSWRLAFVLVGLPGALVALAIKLSIKEPPRGFSDPPLRTGDPERVIAAQALPAVSFRHEIWEIDTAGGVRKERSSVFSRSFLGDRPCRRHRVCCLRHEGGQPGGRWDDGATVFSAAGRRKVADRPPNRGARRGVSVLWRCHDHARNFRAERRRGASHRVPCGDAVCGADRGRRAGLPFLDTKRRQWRG
jgi:hypothetical protein